MRFKKSPQLPGAGRTRAWHHHGSHTPTSPGAILQVKWPVNPNILAASVSVLQNFLQIQRQGKRPKIYAKQKVSRISLALRLLMINWKPWHLEFVIQMELRDSLGLKLSNVK